MRDVDRLDITEKLRKSGPASTGLSDGRNIKACKNLGDSYRLGTGHYNSLIMIMIKTIVIFYSYVIIRSSFLELIYLPRPYTWHLTYCLTQDSQTWPDLIQVYLNSSGSGVKVWPEGKARARLCRWHMVADIPWNTAQSLILFHIMGT